MGFDPATTKFLISARKEGASFTSSVTLGRQWLLVDPNLLRHQLRDLNGQIGDPSALLAGDNTYADQFLRVLGCTDLHATDASTYENADIIHDMNHPIADEYKNRFDAVIDGGTLEHVFNFPTAMKNTMEMPKVGGRVFLFKPANNYLGHGFYQFSPELFYRIFSEANGYMVERMFANEMGSDRFFAVTDPDSIKKRVELVNKQPLVLMVQARRTAIKPIFATTPQQSDYVEHWGGNAEATDAPHTHKQGLRERVRDTLRGTVPPGVRTAAARYFWQPLRAPFRYRQHSLRNRTNFKPVN